VLNLVEQNEPEVITVIAQGHRNSRRFAEPECRAVDLRTRQKLDNDKMHASIRQKLRDMPDLLGREKELL
jgi:hypothetical protein